MWNLLFPGRHLLLTEFQRQYLTRVTSGDPSSLRDVAGKALGLTEPVTTIIWAITSANHSNTRRNPLPANRREAAIESFAGQLEAPSFVYLIDDIGQTPRFAEYVLKKIEVDSQGRFHLTPDNTLVACSTPEVIALYEQLGFRILPVELVDRQSGRYGTETPWQLLDHLVQTGLAGRDWRTDETFVTKVERATRMLYLKYNFGDQIIALHRSPLLTDDGDLTETRDYNTYVRAFDEGAARKYELVKDLIKPGRIVDIGCCTGALIRELTRDSRLHESDFYGIEVARQLFAECLHRKQQGDFGSQHVFFYQKDFAAGPIFPEHSVDTFTTFSLTHEIESYSGRASLERFLQLLYDQLAWQGRWINVDVVGPEDKQQEVYLWLNRDDGRNDDYDREFRDGQRMEFRDYLKGLSTYARFLRFARDFRQGMDPLLEFREQIVEGQHYVVLSMENACEFLSKKDYLDNWSSEMHERFCFWSLSQWKAAAAAAGFHVSGQSRALTNPWIVANRWQGKAALMQRSAEALQEMPWPVTNMVLVAEKTT